MCYDTNRIIIIMVIVAILFLLLFLLLYFPRFPTSNAPSGYEKHISKKKFSKEVLDKIIEDIQKEHNKIENDKKNHETANETDIDKTKYKQDNVTPSDDNNEINSQEEDLNSSSKNE